MTVTVNSFLRTNAVGDYQMPFSETTETFAETSAYYTWDEYPLTWDESLKTWDNCAPVTYTLAATGEIFVIDELKKNIKLLVRVPVSVQEIVAKTVRKSLFDSFGIAETYWDNIKFYMNVCENIHTVDDVTKSLSKNEQEKFALGERLYKELSQMIKESVGFKEELKRHALFNLFFAELTAIKESSHREIGLNKSRSISLVDKADKQITANISEAAAIADEFIRAISIKREFGESLTVADFLTKELSISKQENVAIYDAFLRACEGVLSNIYAAHGDMTVNDFLELVNTPSGYTAFSDFKVGEYEYEEALVRIMIKAVVQQSKPSVSDVVMHVDIPDTDDRGTVQIEDATAATKVYYNKHYYNAPEVNAIVIGGNSADGVLRPNLIRTDGMDDGGRFFEVEIINEHGARATGVISWVSKGY